MSTLCLGTWDRVGGAAGVMARGDAFREAVALSARPLVTLGSRFECIAPGVVVVVAVVVVALFGCGGGG